jgi:HK97 family phage prohead protease
MTTKKIEVRTISSLRAGSGQDAQFILKGRAVTYGALSAPIGNAGFRERVAAGAFTRSLASGDDIKCLHNHSADRVLGRTQNGTLKIQDSPTGLDFVCQLDKNNSSHRDLYSSVQRHDVDSCSFAFVVDGEDGEEFDSDTDPQTGERFTRRTIKRAKLFDLSAVLNPAYPNGTSVQARSAIRTLFPVQSYEQKFIAENGYDPWLTRMRATRAAVEIANDRALLTRIDADLRADKFWNDLSAEGTARLRRFIEARDVASDPGFDCPGSSMSATKDDHEAAAAAHRCLARRCQSADDYAKHDDAATAHDAAANDLRRAPTAVAACRKAGR